MGETAPVDLGTRTFEELFTDYDRLAQQRHQAERFIRDVLRKQHAIRDEIARRIRNSGAPAWEVSVFTNDTVSGAKLETEQEPSAP